MSERDHDDSPAAALLNEGEVDDLREPDDAEPLPDELSPHEAVADPFEPVVPFAYDPSDASVTRRRAWYWWLIGPTAASWALSLAAHAGAAVGAFVLVATVGRHVAPEIRFAYGDGRPELGAADRPGRPDAAPGFAGVPTGLAGPPGEPPAALAEIRSEPPPPAPAPATTPPPPEPPRVPAEPDAAEPPPPIQTLLLPSQAAAVPRVKPRTFDFPPPPEPAAQPPIAPRTDTASAAARPTTSPATDGASAAPGATTAATSAVASAAGSAGGAAAANGSSTAAGGTAGGDRSPDGAGGATTGAGGTAATGRPGIPAGVRDGTGLPAPVYPEASRRKGEQGVVVLEIEVLADGRVGRVDVLDDAGFPRLAQAAVDAVRPHTFRPATTDGVAVRDVITLPFRFTLRRR